MIRQTFILAILGLTSCLNPASDKPKENPGMDITSDSSLETKFERLTKRALADSTITFKLDTLAHFLWDTLVIIQPYYPIDTLEKEVHADLSAIAGTSLTNDGENILAFIKAGQLINYVRLPRDKGDFWSIHDNRVFSKDSCTFEFVRTPNRFTSGQNIVEAKVKRGKSH